MKRRRFEYRGLTVVLAVYLVIALILFTERAGIQYVEAGRALAYLEDDQVVLAGDAYAAQETECLVLWDSESANSLLALEQFEQIFLDMKVGCRWLDVRTEELPEELDAFETVTVLMSDLSPLNVWVLDLTDWVYAGGRVLFACTLSKEPTMMLIEQRLGIAESSYSNELVDSMCFEDGFLLGGDATWTIMDGYDSALQVYLKETAQIYARDGDVKGCPLIWSNDYGRGRFVVDNFGHYEKSVRGFYAASYSLLQDAFAYPVINGSAFYLDDFPSPVPGGDGHYIREMYNMNIDEFYTNVWWPDMMTMADRYGVVYTSVVIENYDDETDGEVVQQVDLHRFKYFGNMVLNEGGEIGFHGYNHQPLSLGNVDYGDILPYHTWDSMDAMANAMTELLRFTHELYPDTQQSVYVPPSNVLSAEGRALLSAQFPQIRTIASNYFAGEMAYEQEFEVAADGVVEQPRVISGAVLDDYMRMCALSELNMHLVNTHFMHPDDLLDEDRGAALGWETLKNTLDGYMEWLFDAVPVLRSLTGSELSGAIQRYGSLAVHRTVEDNQLTLQLDNFVDEAQLLVRLTDKENVSVQGGTLTQLTDSLYLLSATQSEVRVTWGR